MHGKILCIAFAALLMSQAEGEDSKHSCLEFLANSVKNARFHMSNDLSNVRGLKNLVECNLPLRLGEIARESDYQNYIVNITVEDLIGNGIIAGKNETYYNCLMDIQKAASNKMHNIYRQFTDNIQELYRPALEGIKPFEKRIKFLVNSLDVMSDVYQRKIMECNTTACIEDIKTEMDMRFPFIKKIANDELTTPHDIYDAYVQNVYKNHVAADQTLKLLAMETKKNFTEQC